MADCNFWCRDCGENTDHMEVSEARLRVCSKCGMETKFGRSEKSAAVKPKLAAWERPINAGKKESVMPKAKFTAEQIEDIKREKSEGCTDKDLANRFNCSQNTIWRMCHIKQKRVLPAADKREIASRGARNDRGREIASRTLAMTAPAAGSLRENMERIVDERIALKMAELPEMIRVEISEALK